MPKDQEFYLVDELADKLRVSNMTIYRYIKAGKLKAYKLDKEYRIGAKEYQRFLDSISTK